MNDKNISSEVSSSSIQIDPVITDVHVMPDIDSLIKDAESKSIPVLALRDIVIFPNQAVPVGIGREASLQAVMTAQESGRLLMAVSQTDASIENPTSKDIYRTGTLCRVMKVIEMPDGRHTAFLIACERARITRFVKSSPFFTAKVQSSPEINDYNASDMECKAGTEILREEVGAMLKNFSDEESHEMQFSLDQMESVERQINFLCMQVPLECKERQRLLEVSSIKKRLIMLVQLLHRELQYLKVRNELRQRTQSDMNEQQRQHFLEQQMRVIQDELSMGGAPDDDISVLTQRADEKTWPAEMQERFDKELVRLQRYNPQSPEYAIQYAYLDNILNLPWENYADINFTLDEVERVLDRDHYGLRDVKDRIVEQMAVLKQRGDVKAGILCLYGPPGVGKTSLGKSIADATGREYIRVSFGGLHDEAEIRGHRKTYLGAMPGRIISGLQKCTTGNPVFVLDEIDKIGADHKGDPAMALLEVLDPEQNEHFHDNYIDADYDLSKILFIATANTLSTISHPLLDRMELIEISGYITEEKIQIAKRHLVPKKLEDTGLSKGDIEFTDVALERIISEYTRESGVRQLEKKIAKVLRKLVRLKVSGKEYPTVIEADMIPTYLGKREVFSDIYEDNSVPGVVTGLAWTAAGGEILFIETSLSKGKGEKLTLTGNLGDVMKESATIALQYLKAHSTEIGIDPEKFTANDIHIHVPEGAIPKDGPSAGVTKATSLASAFLNSRVRERLAMTGEITLRGKVLPVGGIKEKILAAKRAGITDIVLCEMNRKDIEDIDEMYIKGLTFHYVNTISEVLDIALLKDNLSLK